MPKTSQAQLDAVARYDAKNCKMYTFKLNKRYDMDIIEKLASVPNRQDYIKRIIRKDIESEESKENTKIE